MSAPLHLQLQVHRLVLRQLHDAQQTRQQPIAVTTRLGGTTNADIQDRERSNAANGH